MSIILIKLRLVVLIEEVVLVVKLEKKNYWFVFDSKSGFIDNIKRWAKVSKILYLTDES